MTWPQSLLRGLRFGGDDERRRSAQQRIWEGLPESAKAIRHQWLGHMSTGCTATQGLHEGCDFSCTACYLSPSANQTPPLPLAEAKAQLDQIRAHTGPGGNVQLTAGEVTLLPVGHLSALVRHARALELDPMVMTHGQTFERNPSYLDALMAAGLEKVAIHVDETQRGRDRAPKQPNERDLFVVRDRMARVIRDARARTGRTLHASHTVTVTNRNIDVVPDIVRWTLRNSDAFRMLSLQPTAAVGRTRNTRVSEAELVWQRVREGAARPLNPHTFTFGHQDCNRVCLTFVVRFGDEVELVEVKREHDPVDGRFFDELMSGRFRNFYIDGATGAELLGRWLSLLAREPKYLLQWPAYGLYRAIAALPWAPRFFAAIARQDEWSIHPFSFVVHHFMSSDELDTERGCERLAACSFKVPVGDSMVSMCELNGSEMRAQLNRAQQGRLLSIRPKRSA